MQKTIFCLLILILILFNLPVPGQKSETSEKMKASLETGELLDACTQLLQYFENSQILLQFFNTN